MKVIHKKPSSYMKMKEIKSKINNTAELFIETYF